MEDIFKLPVSSYDEIVKVIKAYGNVKIGISVSLDDLVKSSGMSKFILSKNNGFLVQIGLITKGNKKSPTQICKKLASAYSNNIKDEILTIWRNIFNTDDFIASMLSVLSVKGKLSRDEFISHIVYSANCGNSASYKTGAATIIEILKMTHMIMEDGGYITFSGSVNDLDIQYSNGNQQFEQGQDEEILLTSIAMDKRNDTESTFFVQQYTCESGQIAKMIIPESATEDDLLGFRDMLNIALKRKFKLNLDQ